MIFAETILLEQLWILWFIV